MTGTDRKPSAEEQEEADDTPRWREALRAVENGECGAQLEIADIELRTSMIRNVAAAISAAEAEAREECALIAEEHGGSKSRAGWEIAKAIRRLAPVAPVVSE